MLMKKFFVLIGLLSVCWMQARSQDHVDAIRFSSHFLQGDARSISLGNAMGAVGATFISSSINPAGLALYRSSEASFTLALFNSNVESNYLDNTVEKRKYNFNLPSLNMVFTNINMHLGEPVKEGWVSYTFAAGLARTNNFNFRSEFSSYNTQNSILDYYLDQSKNLVPDALPLIPKMAWDIYLIDNPDSMNPTHYVKPLNDSMPFSLYQRNTISSKGSSYDINFSFAANYSNKIYIGASLTIPTFGYHEKREFYEENEDQATSAYSSSYFNRELDLSGVGVRGSFGLLFRPVHFLRFGAAVHTPTFYRIKGTALYTLGANIYYNGENMIDESTADFPAIDYDLVTPFRSVLSLALISSKFGFLSFDYEMTDYSLAYLDASNYSYSLENSEIENLYGPSHNFRIGGEIRMDIFAFRAGYALYSSPFQESQVPGNINPDTKILSLGLGIREANYFLDFAYSISNAETYYLPYKISYSDVEGAVEKRKHNNFVFTLGMKF
jgi:hypothetical protein